MKMESTTVVVLGAGESGRAACELLLSRGAQVVLRDSKTSESLRRLAQDMAGRGVRVELGASEEIKTALPALDYGVISPGIDPSSALVRGNGRSSVDFGN
ncbi:MAG: hypothetical protein HC904_10760 [Blastochloris sp.]|nr:hypothetical protein [Blastochloris sp.]